MTHGHGQHSQTQDSYWAVSSTQHTGERGRAKGGEGGHCVLRITLNPAHVTRTTKEGRKPLNGPLQMTRTTHTLSPVFPRLCYSTQRLCAPSAPSHPRPPVSQHCARDESVSLCVWRAEWCMVWPGTDRVPRPRDRPHNNSSPHTHKSKNNQRSQRERSSVHSPCSRQSSLSQVCSDPLSNVTINIHQCCYGGLTYLQTTDMNQFKVLHRHRKRTLHTLCLYWCTML